jgi:phage-related baseplate assembly protein
MARTDVLDNMPQIDLLEEEEITFDSILGEMIADYEARYEELTGEELTLYPADSRRILLNVAAGKLYQLAVVMNERFKMNFLQYMYGDYLRNWGSNFGYKEDGTESATVTLRFHLSAAQATDVTVPAGTRATSGDGIYFATDEDLAIRAGETHADISATCTEAGTGGNGYVEGQLNIIADPVNLVESVENTTASDGGHDVYTDAELRELIYNFPATYSTAGPEECYEELVKAYSSTIADVKIITNDEALVQIYVLLLNGEIPDADYLSSVAKYLKDTKATPDTDKTEILAPTPVEYSLKATFYISESQKDVEDALKAAVEDAVEEFVDYTRSKIGRAIVPDTLVSFALAAGASRLSIEEPQYATIGTDEVAICTGIELTYGGMEG